MDRWIALHEGATGPKLRLLASMAGCSETDALGVLGHIWIWGVRGNVSSTGLMKNTSLEHIANIYSCVLTKGVDPMKVAKALVESGWIDENEGSYYIHDWHEHQKPLVAYQATKEANAQRKRNQRLREKEARAASTDGEPTGTEGESPPPDPADGTQTLATTKSKKSKPAKPKPEVKEYAECVHMTEDEHKKLVDAYGEEATAELIRVLDNYKGSSGKKYKSDYRAILTWTVERVQSKSPWLFKKQSGGDSRGSLDDYDYGSMEGSL